MKENKLVKVVLGIAMAYCLMAYADLDNGAILAMQKINDLGASFDNQASNEDLEVSDSNSGYMRRTTEEASLEDPSLEEQEEVVEFDKAGRRRRVLIEK